MQPLERKRPATGRSPAQGRFFAAPTRLPYNQSFQKLWRSIMSMFGSIISKPYRLNPQTTTQPNPKSWMSKMMTRKIVLATFFFSGLAAASEKPILCTTEVRHYCTLSKECEANKDISPSRYKLEFKSPREIQVNKYIDDKLSSSWVAFATKSSLPFEKVFLELDGAFTALTLSKDKKSFVITLHSVAGNHPSSQTELGFCQKTDKNYPQTKRDVL